jgi:intracellular sulfur oxidation DsrE/DsrF family protein
MLQADQRHQADIAGRATIERMLRRYFLSRLGGASALLGVGQQTPAPAASTPFSAARHAQDDWFEQLPGTHRVIFDTWTAGRFAEGIGFAGNYVRVNRDAYSLADKDLAVVICVRHHTAPFAFSDAMWAKYGKQFSDRMSFVDPKTKEPPASNLYREQLVNLSKQGIHLAICALTTRAYTRIIASATDAKAEDVFDELAAHTVAPGHFVPAGVVAVTRAQERGYAMIAIG